MEGPVVCKDLFLFFSIRYGKNVKKCLSQLGMEKRKNRKIR